MFRLQNEIGLKLSSSLEDYLESIYLIQRDQTVARMKDIASRLGVTAPSVTGAIKSLNKLGLVEHSNYGYVKLSETGGKIAADIFRVHQALTDFLHIILGLDYQKAESDACRIEHSIEPETVRRLADFLEFAISPSKGCKGCAQKFNEWYLEKDK